MIRRPRRRTRRDVARPSWKDKLVREHVRSEARGTIARLRAAVRTARLERNEALAKVKAYCRRLRHESHASNAACSTYAAEEARTWAPRLDGALRTLDAERREQKQLQEIERRNRSRTRVRSTRTERRSESDDEVRANIPADLHPLWSRVRQSIKGSPRMSRTEAFLKYAEEHPSEAFDVRGIEDATERMIREHEAGLRSARDPRSKARRRR